MARESLYKGKTKESGEWVRGFLSSPFTINIAVDSGVNDELHLVPVEVDPETVCQYIGVNARLKKKIFEHDILSGKGKIVIVRYDKFGIPCLCDDNRGISWSFEDCELVKIKPNDFKIIGCLADNPELLEVAPVVEEVEKVVENAGEEYGGDSDK